MSVKVLSCMVCLGSLAGCGGGGSNTGTTSMATYTVGGLVSGLSSGVSVSLNNGAESLKVSANGAFTAGEGWEIPIVIRGPIRA